LLGASAAVPRRPPPGDQPADPPDAAESGSLAASQRPVPIGGRLARALGSDRSNFSQIMGVALQVGDARLRLDALRVGLRLLDAEPDLRAEVLQTFDGLDDAFLAGWLTQVAGAHAEEFARRTARITRSRPLRQRAAAVAQLLRTTDPAHTGG
jgi:hypothetical protein